jgi:hypothetical protein
MACGTRPNSKRGRLRNPLLRKMEAGRSLIKILRKNHFYHTEQSTADFEVSTNPADTPVGFAALPGRYWGIHNPESVEANVGGLGARDGDQRSQENGEAGRKG